MNQDAFQIVINDFEENPKIHIRYKDGNKFLGIHSASISEVVEKGYITQEEVDQVQAVLQKVVDAERLDNPITEYIEFI